MTFWEALWNSVRFVAATGAFIGLLFWSIYAWVEGEWWERIASFMGIVLLFAVVVWQFGVPK